jgi:hypothetical protein
MLHEDAGRSRHAPNERADVVRGGGHRAPLRLVEVASRRPVILRRERGRCAVSFRQACKS